METATVISDSCRQSAYEYDLNAMLAMLVLYSLMVRLCLAYQERVDLL